MAENGKKTPKTAKTGRKWPKTARKPTDWSGVYLIGQKYYQ
jgi:hypothetical protein